MPNPPTNAIAEQGSRPDSVKLTWTAGAGTAPAAAANNAPPITTVNYEVTARPTLTVHHADKSPLEIYGLETDATYSFDVRTVADGEKSPPATTNDITLNAAPLSPAWWWSSWIISVGFVVAGVIALLTSAPQKTRVSVMFASALVGVFLMLLSAINGSFRGRQGFGFWRAIIGTDRRVSTSYLTTGLWTLLVGFALAYLSARTWFYGDKGLFGGFITGAKGKPPAVWDDYLILLGGPFAALVLARGIITTKVQDQTVQKTLADDGTASLLQALTDDTGNIELIDSQYLLFNLVALAYVIVGFASHGRLPAIPAVLLALTGSSAATYVLNKTVQNSTPTITGVNPGSFRPGERIVITGHNFLPAGPNRLPTVTIGGKQAFVDAHGSSTRIAAIVPLGVPAGVQSLVLTTAARATTESYTVEVLTDRPQIVAVDPRTPTIGQPMQIDGVGFTGALDPTTTCTVHIGDATPISATAATLASGDEEISIDAVPTVPTGTPVAVVVRTPRLTDSPPVNVTFKPQDVTAQTGAPHPSNSGAPITPALP